MHNLNYGPVKQIANFSLIGINKDQLTDSGYHQGKKFCSAQKILPSGESNLPFVCIQFHKSVTWLAMLNLQEPCFDHLTGSAQP